MYFGFFRKQKAMDAPAQQPMDIEGQCLTNAAKGPWKVGLCSCLADPVKCCCGCFCPCVVTFWLIEKVAPIKIDAVDVVIKKESAILWCLAVWLIGGGTGGVVLVIAMILLALGIIKKYNIEEDILTTLFKSVCCLFCYQIQWLRHAEIANAESLAP